MYQAENITEYPLCNIYSAFTKEKGDNKMAGRNFSEAVQFGIVKANLEKNNGIIQCELCGKQIFSIGECHKNRCMVLYISYIFLSYILIACYSGCKKSAAEINLPRQAEKPVQISS